MEKEFIKEGDGKVNFDGFYKEDLPLEITHEKRIIFKGTLGELQGCAKGYGMIEKDKVIDIIKEIKDDCEKSFGDGNVYDEYYLRACNDILDAIKSECSEVQKR